MPHAERSVEISADPERLRQTLAALERWPVWCPLFRKVAPAAPEGGPDGDWSIVALLGSIPFSAFARLTIIDDGDQVMLATLTSASPVEYARYAFALASDSSSNEAIVTLRVDYGFSRGPGGWLVERFLVRRRLAGQLEATLVALTRAVEGGSAAS